MEVKDKVLREGVEDAFAVWLSQHNVSFPALLEEVIERVFRVWLDEHEDCILEMIAKSVTRNI